MLRVIFFPRYFSQWLFIWHQIRIRVAKAPSVLVHYMILTQVYLRRPATRHLQMAAASPSTATFLLRAEMKHIPAGWYCPLPTWRFTPSQSWRPLRKISNLIRCWERVVLAKFLKAGWRTRLRLEVAMDQLLLSKNWTLRACKVSRSGR